MDIEEIQSDRAVDLLARNKQQAEKIEELERIVTASKNCVQIVQDSSDRKSKQIGILKEMLIQYQMAKLCWCDECQEKRSMKEWRAKLEKELNALVIVKEGQKPPTGIQRVEVEVEGDT